jgi:hypothetical protein
VDPFGGHANMKRFRDQRDKPLLRTLSVLCYMLGPPEAPKHNMAVPLLNKGGNSLTVGLLSVRCLVFYIISILILTMTLLGKGGD